MCYGHLRHIANTRAIFMKKSFKGCYTEDDYETLNNKKM